MRIAVFDNLPEGGAKRVVFEQVRYLASHHTVLYFTNTRATIFKFDELPIEIKKYDLEMPKFVGLWRPLQELALLSLREKYKRITKDIDQAKCDVVLVHPCGVTQAPMLLQFLKTPSVYYMEEPLRVASEPALFPIEVKNIFKQKYEILRRKIIEGIDRSGVRSAKLLLANSTFTSQNIFKHYHRNAIALHPGVDTTIFRESGKKNESEYFLFIGEKSKINGYDLLQDALKLSKIKIPIRYITFKNNNFTLSDQELAKIYQKAFATLCLSHREPFGLTAVESIACGTPVIAVNEGGYTETVTNGKSGVLIERHAKDLKNILEYFYQGKFKFMPNKKLMPWDDHGRLLEKYLHSAITK